MNKFFEVSRGDFIPVNRITEVYAELVDYEESRDEWCVRLRIDNEMGPRMSKPLDSWQDAYNLARLIVLLINDDEKKVIRLPEFVE